MRDPLIFSGSADPAFAEAICKHMGVKLSEMEMIHFSNDNMMIRVKENVREADVFVIQTSCTPVSDRIIETFLILDAMKSASAARVTAVIPYFPYVRSDKKDQPRISIAAKLMANLLDTAGADRILTMELHSPQIQGFFNVPVDQLLAIDVICNYFKDKYDPKNSVLVAADAGEGKKIGPYASRLNLPMAIIHKKREGNTDQVVATHLIGDVEGKNALLIDDEIASGGTLCEAAKFLKKNGALMVSAAAVHPVLSGNAMEKINESVLDELVVTDTIPIKNKKELCPKIVCLTVAPLFAQTIQRIHSGDSVSDLF